MSKNRTESSKFRSPSTGDYCTSAQYLAEIICQRCADKDKVGTLPYKFWNLPKWKKLYVRQVGLANKLIKAHGDDFIRFIKSKSGSKIISLGMKNIESQYKNFLTRNPVAKIGSEILTVESKTYSSRQSFNKNTLASKLRGIENGKKTGEGEGS